MGANADLILRAYHVQADAWSRARRGEGVDVAELSDLYDPAVVLDEVSDFPDARSYRGYDGLNRWFESFRELYDDLRFELGAPEENGDKVLVPTRQWFRSRSGVATEWEITHVWTLREGRIVHITGFRDAARARAAAGLGEAPGLGGAE